MPYVIEFFQDLNLRLQVQTFCLFKVIFQKKKIRLDFFFLLKNIKLLEQLLFVSSFQSSDNQFHSFADLNFGFCIRP